MDKSNRFIPISDNEAAESLVSLLHASSSAPQLPFENVGKDQAAAMEEEVKSIVNSQALFHHEIRPDDPEIPSSPSQVECKILNMSLLRIPSSISSRATRQSNLPDETSSVESGTRSRGKNEAIVEHAKALSIPSKSSARKTPPELLMHLLLDHTNHSTMHFLPKGDAFVISNLNEFTKSFMKKYFRLTKFGCFIGKMKRWGFTHSSEGLDPEFYVFRHPLFHRDDPKALKKIKYCPRSSKEAKLSFIPFFGHNSRSQRGSSPTNIDGGPLQSIQDTVNRHVELLMIQRNHQRYQGRPNTIVPQQASTAKQIVEAAIACLKRDDTISKKSIRKNWPADLNCPFSNFAEAHRESRSHHIMMLAYLQSNTTFNGSKSSLSQHS